MHSATPAAKRTHTADKDPLIATFDAVLSPEEVCPSPPVVRVLGAVV